MITNPVIFKHEAVAAYGDSQAALGRALGIGRSAVHQWPADKPIPNEQALKLVLLRPEIFGARIKLDESAA